MKQESTLPDDEVVKKLLQDHLQDGRHGTCAVASMVHGRRRSVVVVGYLGKEDVRPATEHTLFEIGSLTKGFTGLLLSEMVLRAEVSLATAVNDCLPEAVVPRMDGREITLEDLATHTSSLPALPDNGGAFDPANPYAAYTVDRLYAFLRNFKLTRPIGAEFEYSNLGFGLLGHALSCRLGESFGSALKSRVLIPLSMGQTCMDTQEAVGTDHAHGHGVDGARVPFWGIPTLAGAGAMRSTGNDLLAFLSFVAGGAPASLRDAHAAQFTTRRPKKLPGNEIVLGWHVRYRGDEAYAWHNGGTGGFRSYLSFSLDRPLGLAIISNGRSADGVDALAQSMLHA